MLRRRFSCSQLPKLSCRRFNLRQIFRQIDIGGLVLQHPQYQSESEQRSVLVAQDVGVAAEYSNPF